MQEINYIGEHLLPGKIGQLAIMLSFSMALLSAAAYFLRYSAAAGPLRLPIGCASAVGPLGCMA